VRMRKGPGSTPDDLDVIAVRKDRRDRSSPAASQSHDVPAERGRPRAKALRWWISIIFLSPGTATAGSGGPISSGSPLMGPLSPTPLQFKFRLLYIFDRHDTTFPGTPGSISVRLLRPLDQTSFAA